MLVTTVYTTHDYTLLLPLVTTILNRATHHHYPTDHGDPSFVIPITHYVNHARHFHQHCVQARSLSINSQLIYLVTHSIIHRAFTYIPTSSLMYAQFILSYHLSSFLYAPSKKTTHHHLVIFGWVVIHSITHRVITDLPTSSYLFTQYATYFFFSLITPHTHP